LKLCIRGVYILDKDTFLQVAKKSGYAKHNLVIEYIAKNPKETYENEDIEEVYRLQEDIYNRAIISDKYGDQSKYRPFYDPYQDPLYDKNNRSDFIDE